MDQHKLQTVKRYVAAYLKEQFGNEVVFDPIEVRADIGGYGDEIVWVDIVFDGDQSCLVPRIVGLVPDILPHLEAEDISAFPVPRFTERSEWESEQRRRSRAVQRKKRVAAR